VTRPRFEIADIIRKADARIASRYRESLTWPEVKVFSMRLCAAGRRRWAAIVINAPAADIRRSLITPAAIATARSARPMRVRSGLPHGNANCYPSTTIIWFSACRTRWFR